MPFLYFAYGSNLLPQRLLKRCPSAKEIGKATARGYDIDFSKVSKDGSGKATLVEDQRAQTPGALYEICDRELHSLDQAEDVGNRGYDRVNKLKIEMDGSGEGLEAVSYIANHRDHGLAPYDWYLALVLAGLQHHNSDTIHFERVTQYRYTVDEKLDRSGRKEALNAFMAHGIIDYAQLLKPVR